MGSLKSKSGFGSSGTVIHPAKTLRAPDDLLVLGPRHEAFMQKHLFASARVIAQHFLTTVPANKDILQRQ
jgi:hypothetical protein